MVRLYASKTNRLFALMVSTPVDDKVLEACKVILLKAVFAIITFTGLFAAGHSPSVVVVFVV